MSARKLEIPEDVPVLGASETLAKAVQELIEYNDTYAGRGQSMVVPPEEQSMLRDLARKAREEQHRAQARAILQGFMDLGAAHEMAESLTPVQLAYVRQGELMRQQAQEWARQLHENISAWCNEVYLHFEDVGLVEPYYDSAGTYADTGEDSEEWDIFR